MVLEPDLLGVKEIPPTVFEGVIDEDAREGFASTHRLPQYLEGQLPFLQPVQPVPS